MDAGAYLIGCALLAVVAGALAYGAWSARSGLLPHWTGARARLAEIVTGLATLVVVGELLGAVGLFNRAAVVVAAVGGGGGLVVIGRFARPGPEAEIGETEIDETATVAPPRSPRIEVVAATVAVAVVGAQWAAKVGFALDKGMTHPDTVWYHAPYAAQFVQNGHLLRQLDRTDPLHAFAGQTSELLHAVLLLCLGRDVLSPLVNVAWAGVALLAAWCLGSRRGAGALCVLGATFVLGLPMIEATHPGQASNDVAAGALLLAALALLVDGGLARSPTVLAGLAAGLALGTKVTAAAPVAVLTIGVVWLAARRRRAVTGAWWCGAVAVTGSFWFVRNVVVAHNPLPYYTLHFGPLTLSGAPQRHPDAVARYLFDGHVWRIIFRPGLEVALGRAWPIVIVVGAGAALALGRRSAALERLAAGAALAGLVAYLFTPYTADGLAFTFNVRYATPSLLAAVVVFSCALATRRRLWRRAATVVMLALIIADLTARNRERVPAWPSGARVLGPVAAIAILVVVAVCLVVAARGGRVRYGVIAAVVVGLALIVGWPVQRHALDHRYVDAGLPLDVVNAALHDVHHARIAFFGTDESYPFFGTDISNHVARPRGPRPDAPPEECRRWADVLLGYEYVVVAHQPFVFEGPPEGVLARDASATRVAGDDAGTLYRIDAPLTGAGC